MSSRRVTDLLLDASIDIARTVSNDQSCTLRFGTVHAVTGATITVQLGDARIPGITHLKQYTPTVGDVVWLLHQNSTLVAIGTPA